MFCLYHSRAKIHGVRVIKRWIISKRRKSLHETKAWCTRGPDEVIAKSPIWLKLYQMNIWNPSRKDKKSFFQNMN